MDAAVPQAPVVSGGLDDAMAVLKSTYGFTP
jgi:hypothetical protein